MGDSTARSLVLFFYLSLLDGELTLKLSRQCADILRLSDFQSADEAKARFIQTTLKHFKIHAHLRHSHGGRLKLKSPSFIGIPPDDLNAWYDYWKTASDDEVVCMVWTKVLGLSEKEIARVLELSDGSMDHRISMGLRRAGGSVRSLEVQGAAHA